jgi:K+-transporting ATPase KdpF subunit
LGLVQSLPESYGDEMITFAAILAAALLTYLGAALLKPEWFE